METTLIAGVLGTLLLLLLAGTAKSSEEGATLGEFYAYQQTLLLKQLQQDLANSSILDGPSCTCPIDSDEGNSHNDPAVYLKGLKEEYAISSCQDLYYEPSRYYYITTETSAPMYLYCEMNRVFYTIYYGNWLRVANVDMRMQTETCPTGFGTLVWGNDYGDSRRYCTRKGNGCTSHFFPVYGYKYQKICGKVIAFQKGKPDAFFPSISSPKTINEVYVDGVSITCGLPRQHIWTFAAAMHEVNTVGRHLCPCTNRQNTLSIPIPSFVGQNYFCDTGSESTAIAGKVYDEDPLWDGAGCGPYHDCCLRQDNQEYFCSSLTAVSSDPIEVRICGDQLLDEDILLQQIQLFVK